MRQIPYMRQTPLEPTYGSNSQTNGGVPIFRVELKLTVFLKNQDLRNPLTTRDSDMLAPSGWRMAP
jgi:hypothetical protein